MPSWCLLTWVILAVPWSGETYARVSCRTRPTATARCEPSATQQLNS
jgi:hypothetical protein